MKPSSSSPQLSSSPSSTFTKPSKPSLGSRRRRRTPPPSPSSISPPSQTPSNQFSSSSSPTTSSYSPPLIFLSAIVPLPTFRGLPAECPVSHLTLFNRLFPSSYPQTSRNFAISLVDDAALWHELTIQPHPSLSWDDTKSAFLRAFRAPETAGRSRAELMSLRQRGGESVTAYHLRLRWILKRWEGHGLSDSMVRGLFVDGLREEFHGWVMLKKPATVEEAVRVAMDVEEGGSVGRKGQCQCWKHQCWKKYEREGSGVDAGDGATAADSPVGAVSVVERIGGTMIMAAGVFFLNVFFFCPVF